MIAIWMGFAIVSGGCLMIGAFAAERFAQTLRLPTRLVWVTAIAATTVWPVIAGIGVIRMGANKAHDHNSAERLPVRSAASLADAIKKSDDLVPTSFVVPSAVSAHTRGLTASQMLATIRTLDSHMVLGHQARVIDLWLLAGWAILSLVFSSRLIYALVVLHKHRRSWQHALIDGFPVRLSQNAGPAVVGLRQPEIVLPAWVLHFEPALRVLIVQHEREHQRARDPMLLFCITMLRVVFPWNPVLSWQVRRLQLAVEVDCDSRVLRQYPQQERYGLLLLSIAQYHANGSFQFSPALVESHTHLERRIIVMRKRNTRASRLRAAAFGTAAIGGAVLAGYVMPSSNVFAMTVTEIRSIPSKVPAVNDLQSSVKTSTTNLTVERHHNPSTADTHVLPDSPRRAIPERRDDNPVSVKDAADSIPKTDSASASNVHFWVERQAAVDTWQNNVRPIYPAALRTARVEGEVRAQFIVDTSGYMLPGSFKVLSSTNDLFSSAVREAMPRMKFIPAEVGGQKTQQLVELPFTFTIASATPGTSPSASPKASNH